MLQIVFSSKFKKDYKRVRKQGCDPEKMAATLEKLAKGEKLPHSMHDHELAGAYKGHRECHNPMA